MKYGDVWCLKERGWRVMWIGGSLDSTGDAGGRWLLLEDWPANRWKMGQCRWIAFRWLEPAT